MKIFKNRIVLASICLVMSLSLIFAISPLINKQQTKAVSIARVVNNISQGKQITKEDIEMVSVGGYGLTDNAVKNADDVVGRYATADLFAGNYIMKEAISDELTNELKLDSLSGEYLAVSFTCSSLSSSVSSQLKSGDIISIISVIDETAVIPPELTYVEIINCTSSTATDTDVVVTGESKNLISTVTVFATTQQSLKIAQLDKQNVIHTALVYRGNNDNKQKLLDTQKEYLKTTTKAESETLDKKDGE